MRDEVKNHEKKYQSHQSMSFVELIYFELTKTFSFEIILLHLRKTAEFFNWVIETFFLSLTKKINKIRNTNGWLDLKWNHELDGGWQLYNKRCLSNILGLNLSRPGNLNHPPEFLGYMQ